LTLQLGMVDILREYLEAYGSVLEMIARFRANTLTYAEVQNLVSETDQSVLYRLKERSHALFRIDDPELEVQPLQREVLFDLAIGALFLETMIFREAFYQRAVFGQQVGGLRSTHAFDADPIIAELEKIVSAANPQIDESLRETEVLLEQTRDELRELLRNHSSDGIVNRYLVEHAEKVEEVFPEGVEPLLTMVHGSLAKAYSLIGCSYLESGHFGEAQRVLERALEDDTESISHLKSLIFYCRGMTAFLQGDLESALSGLRRWNESGTETSLECCSARSTARAYNLALNAVSSIQRQAKSTGADELASLAHDLSDKLSPPAAC
jgi:tetratricopeptide (TPR) repeat protein